MRSLAAGGVIKQKHLYTLQYRPGVVVVYCSVVIALVVSTVRFIINK